MEGADIIVMIIFVIAFLVQIYYYLIIYSQLASYKQAEVSSKKEGVSVIIAARNELENLKKNLHLFFEQDYPDFQIIVVNDRSWDESKYYLADLAKEHKNLKVVEVDEIKGFKQGKKFALTLGIKGAAHDLLLITDADCVPSSKNWIKEAVNCYKDETEVLIGYGAYKKEGGLLNKLVRLDTFFTAIQYLSFAIAGKPYMGVGRNISYRKNMFLRNKGFASHNHIMAGDDDLFVNEVANSKNTSVLISKDAFTLSEPSKSFKEWIHQKKRHLSVGKYYKMSDKFVLGLQGFTNIMFYLSAVYLLIQNFYPEFVVTAILIRLIIQLVINYGCLRKLQETDLLILTPLYDLFAAFFYPSIAISNLIFKSNKW
ncbi:MAG: glycosyltransferase [Bacteroidia bacterium]|nr:glycosyltransferase [Bacteroidia bacterium]